MKRSAPRVIRRCETRCRPAVAPATELTEATAAAAATTAAEATEEDAAGRERAAAARRRSSSCGHRRICWPSRPRRPTPTERSRSRLRERPFRRHGRVPRAGGDRRDVEVYVDEENGEVLAVDVATCEVVLRAASPERFRDIRLCSSDQPRAVAVVCPHTVPAACSRGRAGAGEGVALVSPAMAGNPLTDPAWASDLADTVERVVGTVRERATTPVVHIARGVVYGLMASFLAVTAITLLIIGSTAPCSCCSTCSSARRRRSTSATSSSVESCASLGGWS